MSSMSPDDDLKTINRLQKTVYMKCWKIYKLRTDKNAPNNFDVAEKIEESIKDNINDADLIKRTKELCDEVYQRR